MSASSPVVLTRAEAEDILFREARLLDTFRLQEWLELFTPDGLYWIPIDDGVPVERHASIVYDPPARREERVFHQLNVTFPAQNPRSRLLHVVSNVIVDPCDGGFAVQSSQVIYEMRTGDSSQIGLGEIRPIVASVEHILRPHEGRLKIARKKILLMNRDGWHGNMTVII